MSYDDSKALDEIVNRYSTDRPVIGECRLKVLKYQPPNLPAGKACRVKMLVKFSFLFEPLI